MKFRSKPSVGIPSGYTRAHFLRTVHKTALAIMMMAVLSLSTFTSYMPATAAEGDPVLVVPEAPTLKQSTACADENAREVFIPQTEGISYYVSYEKHGFTVQAYWMQSGETSQQNQRWSFYESEGPFCVGLEAAATVTTVDLDWVPFIIPAEKCGASARFSGVPGFIDPAEDDLGKLSAYWEADESVQAEDGSISRTYRVTVGKKDGIDEQERWDAFVVSRATERVRTLTLPPVQPCDVEATPVPPVLVPSAQCGVEATIQIAETEGVAYTQTREGSVVTVDAAAEPSYFLTEGAEKTWAVEIPQVEECEIVEPTIEPSPEPTVEPTVAPTLEPTIQPSPEPTVEPTVAPTLEPTIEPSVEPAPDVERVEVHSGNTSGPGADVLGIAMGGLAMLAGLMLGIRILHRGQAGKVKH